MRLQAWVNSNSMITPMRNTRKDPSNWHYKLPTRHSTNSSLLKKSVLCTYNWNKDCRIATDVRRCGQISTYLSKLWHGIGHLLVEWYFLIRSAQPLVGQQWNGYLVLMLWTCGCFIPRLRLLGCSLKRKCLMMQKRDGVENLLIFLEMIVGKNCTMKVHNKN